jgi:ribonucleoside-triphosphate reductase
MGSVAKPAQSLEVLLNHMLQAWMAGATVFSGGQGYVNFNTLLSPFCRGRSYEEIKQAIQGFIFNCNMSLICRGGQVLFSSIALDLSCPPVLADEPAISFGGVEIGTYKDYQAEADLIFRAVCEVSNEKDGQGKYHRFPNILFNIREGDLDEYKGTCKILHETGANNPTIYYNNCIDLERSTMGCRTSLPMNYRKNYQDDCVNTGNFAYNTINLPLIALTTNADIDAFYNKLDEICEICYTSLIHRRNTVIDVIYNKHMSDFLLQEDKDTGKPLYDIDRTTVTIGYCGLNECLKVLTNEDITNSKAEELGVEIIQFINRKKDEFHNRDGLRWSVIASPAESTAFRFAKINREKYPSCPVQGTGDKIYLTNSHHIPVASGVPWSQHIQNAGKFAHLSLGGDILHIWSGEVWSDPEAIWNLNRKILLYANPIFWAFSKVFSYCRECEFTINDKLSVCPICGSQDLEVFDRITGYYLAIDTFNNGKLGEFEDRYRHKITEKTV